MHELSLAENLREIIEAEAGRQGFGQVKKVCLQIGKLSCVMPSAMRFCFDEVMRGSMAEGAVLEIEEVEGKGFCPVCRTTVSMEALYDLCPECQKPMDVIQGLEMRIQALEVVG